MNRRLGGSEPQTIQGESFSESAGAWCGAFFVIVLLCYCVSPRVPDARHRRGAEIRERARQNRQATEAKHAKESRQSIIEKSLIIKTVVEAKGDGKLVLGDSEIGTEQRGNLSYNANDQDQGIPENESTCVICIEPMEVGDRVAWAKNSSEECFHVFHHDCIVSWLEHHDDCPSCRNSMLNIEASESTPSSEGDCGSADGDFGSGASVVFEMLGGLISRAAQAAQASYALLPQDSQPFDDDGGLAAPLGMRKVLSMGEAPLATSRDSCSNVDDLNLAYRKQRSQSEDCITTAAKP